jgi:hypothetical protein
MPFDSADASKSTNTALGRYRGLKKNTHRLLVTCALANLFMVRRHLLRCQRA